MDNEIDRKIDVTAIQFLLDQNRQQTHDWTPIGSGANGVKSKLAELQGHKVVTVMLHEFDLILMCSLQCECAVSKNEIN